MKKLNLSCFKSEFRDFNCRLLLIFLLFGTQFLFAQAPVSLQFTQKDGLPDKEFYRIAEDKTGLIWFAGNKGLTKYDGSEFVTLENSKKRGFSVFELVVDDQNRKWCINISGQLFYAVDHELKLYKDFKEDFKGTLPEIRYYDGYLILSSHFLIITIHLKTNSIEKISIKGKFFTHPTLLKNEVVFFAGNSLFALQDGKAVKKYSTNFNSIDVKSQLVRMVVLDDGKILIISLRNGKISNGFLLKDEQLIEIKIPKEILQTTISVIKKSRGKVWFLTKDGAFQTEFRNENLALHKHFLKGSYITDFLKDEDGNSWFTSLEKGVIVLPNTDINSINFDKNLGEPLKVLRGKNNDVLFGFSSGNVLIYNTLTKKKQLLNFETKDRISSLNYDKFRDKYLVFQDIQGYEIETKSPFKINKLRSNAVAIKDLDFISKDEFIFVQFSRSGLAFRDYFPKIINDKAELFVIKKRGYTSHYNPLNKLIYFGMVDELIVYDKKNQKKFIIKSDEGKDIFCHTIINTENGFTWVATFNNGIFKIKNEKVVAHFNTENGLLSNRINALGADGNKLWVATEKGIQIIDLQNGKVIFDNIFKQDGIPSYDISDVAVMKDEVYFTSTESVFSISKNRSQKNFSVPKIYFTGIFINQEKQELNSKYRLKSSASNVVIQFNANGLRGISATNFEYRLKGLNNNWATLNSGDKEVQFANLPSGDLTFQIRPVLKNGEKAEIKEIKFEVSKEFYQSIWFWLMMLLLSIGLIYLYFRRKLKREKVESEKEKARLFLDNQLISLKLENLQSQMNPHFIFNALNSIQEYIVHNKKELASSYLVKFSRLIRLYLDQSRENSVSLEQELIAMKLYLELEKVRFEDKLHNDLKIDCENKASQIYLPPLFIQPYVENAFKHGLLHRKTDRKLLVEFNYDEARKILSICIEDNGIGRIAAQKLKSARPNYHTSFATSANEKRVALINENRAQKISVEIEDLMENGIASGTRVCIEIPQ